METITKRFGRKQRWILLIVVLLIAAGLMLARQVSLGQQAALLDNLITEPIGRGELMAFVIADGVVRSEQSAELAWSISGEVAAVPYQVGDLVQAGDILATLVETSLPQQVILARGDLIEAQQALDDLLHSQTQQAQALTTLQASEDTLDNALHPEMMQAQAQTAVVTAERNLESIQRRYDILTTPPTASGIQQVYDNILLTQEIIKDLEDQVTDLEKTLQRTVFNPYESLIAYKQAYANASAELARQQGRLLNLRNRHNVLLSPPDPIEMAVAEADLATALAQLSDAQREWNRVKDGATAADIAVFEAQLADTRREYERVKDGPTADDLAAAEARLAAAQAILNQSQLKAPFDGVLTQVKNQPGDQVNDGTLSFRLDKLSHLLVDVQISELDINQIAVGQTVLLSFDAILAAQYHGVINDISPVGDTVNGMVTFEVCIEIIDADAVVRPGMTSTVEIEISRVEDALLVPNQALRSLNGQRVVFVVGGSTATEDNKNLTGQRTSATTGHPVTVTIGQSSGKYSEVIAGDLQENDRIVINPPSEWMLVP